MNLKNKKLFSGTGLVVAAVLLLAVNALSNIVFKSARLDFTENKLFTLSQGTRNILANLDEPVTLKFYFSEKLATNIPPLAAYANRVRDLLEEYASLAKGKINLQVLNPEPFSEEEDQAVQYRLQGVPVDAAGTLLYFGLVATNATDEQETITFFQEDKEQSLEYDLSKLIYNLAHPKKKTVGLLSTLPMNSAAMNPFVQDPQAQQPWMIVDVIRQTFNLINVETTATAIPDSVDILMLVHPKGLSDATLYAIDQFVLKGGRLIAFVDSWAEADNPMPDPQNPMASMMAPRNSDLKKLLDQWGVELVEHKFAADQKSAIRVSINNGMRPQSIDYLAWLNLRDQNLSQADFVTASLKQLTLASSGILKSRNVEGINVVPLLETSDKAMAMDVGQLMMPNPATLLSSYTPGTEKLLLAARISGKVKSAFTQGKPGGGDAGLKEAKDPVNIIVVADTDMLTDKFWVNVQNFFGQRIAVPRADNGSFVVNALDNLSGSNDLISLRSRGLANRPFTKVQELQSEAEKNYLNKEKALQARLQETERKINDLQSKKQGSDALILSPEQQQEIEKFRDEQVKTRKELRAVQHELRASIESLGGVLKFINIGLLPLMVMLAAIGMVFYRHRKQQA